MEAPTSPVMPCKMDLDKVCNHSAEVLHEAAAAKSGECGAWGATSSCCCVWSPFQPHSSSVGLMGLRATAEGTFGAVQETKGL